MHTQYALDACRLHAGHATALKQISVLCWSLSAFPLAPLSAIAPSRSVHAPLSSPVRRAVTLLVLTQMIGWGTTYHLPVILGQTFAIDLGLPLEVIYGGLTIMLLASAVLSPRIGVTIDRIGPGRFLCAGSLCAAGGLIVLAGARGLSGYATAWLFFGVAMGTMLGNAAFVALARIAGRQSRRAISTMLLFTAANPFVFYPVTAYLADAMGWRNMCLLYACAHLLIGLPLHLKIASLQPAVSGDSADDVGKAERDGVLPTSERRGALVLIMIAFAGHGLIGWGLSPHMINLLGGLGVPGASAVFLASLHGPAQIAGRFVDYGFGADRSPLSLGVIAAMMTPIGLLVLIFAGQSLAVAVLAIALYGISSGLGAIVRAAIPLNLFGRNAYGATLGRIALPMNITCAVAPILFASLIGRIGPELSLLIAASIATVVLAVMMLLAQRARAAVAPISA